MVVLSAAAKSDFTDDWTECRRRGIWPGPGKMGEVIDSGERMEGSVDGGDIEWEVNASVG
jgi:hypothetical protein